MNGQLSPGKNPPLPTGWEAGWKPEPGQDDVERREDGILHSHRRENLKPYIALTG
jgi:hypothetical protein